MVCTGEKDAPGMDHVDTMLKCDANDVFLSQVGGDGRQTCSNLVGLIRLLPVGAHPIFVRVDRDGVHHELVRRPEHSDRDFLYNSRAHRQ